MVSLAIKMQITLQGWLWYTYTECCKISSLLFIALLENEIGQYFHVMLNSGLIQSKSMTCMDLHIWMFSGNNGTLSLPQFLCKMRSVWDDNYTLCVLRQTDRKMFRWWVGYHSLQKSRTPHCILFFLRSSVFTNFPPQPWSSINCFQTYLVKLVNTP